MESYNALGEVDADITVGQLKTNMFTATDTEKENHARQANTTSETNLPSQSATHSQVKKDHITLCLRIRLFGMSGTKRGLDGSRL